MYQVTGQVPGHHEPTKGKSEDQVTPEIDFTEVLGAQEKKFDAEMLANTSRKHQNQQYPATQQNDIIPQVQQYQPQRERVIDVL